MKENTIKKLRRTIEDYRTDVDTGLLDVDIAALDAIESLARRLSKLERAGKVAPEHAYVKESLPRIQSGFSSMSEDVLITVNKTAQFIGYYNFFYRQWMVYAFEEEATRSVPLRKPVKNWQYITDATTPPPTVALSAWVSVKERLPEIGKLYRNLSNNVLVYVEGYENAERIYIGFYNYSLRTWEVVGRSDIHTVVIKWQPLPDDTPQTETPADNWISVKERLPELEKGMSQVSIDVLVLCEKGCKHIAYYNYRRLDWTMKDSNNLGDVEPVKWKPLE